MATKKASSTNKKAPAKAPVKTSSAVTKTTVKTVSAPVKKQTLGEHVDGSLRSPRLWRAVAAEFIGTFLLASIFVAGQGQPIFVLFGLAGIVLLIGAISGGHINPAVTVAAWVTRRIGWLRALAYIFVQFLGAAVAYFALHAFLGGATQPTAEQQMYGSTAATLYQAADIAKLTGKEWFVFFEELLGTAILGFAIAAATRTVDTLTKAFTAGFGIFVALMIGLTIAGYASATSILNPAVALTLQAYAPTVWAYAIYILAPVIGAVLGFIIYDLVRGKNNA